jgi:hypothetical protein
MQAADEAAIVRVWSQDASRAVRAKTTVLDAGLTNTVTGLMSSEDPSDRHLSGPKVESA